MTPHKVCSGVLAEAEGRWASRAVGDGQVLRFVTSAGAARPRLHPTRPGLGLRLPREGHLDVPRRFPPPPLRLFSVSEAPSPDGRAGDRDCHTDPCLAERLLPSECRACGPPAQSLLPVLIGVLNLLSFWHSVDTGQSPNPDSGQVRKARGR